MSERGTRITFVRSKEDRNSLSTRMKGGADGWERRNESNGDYQKNSLRKQNRLWYFSCLHEKHQDGQCWLKWKRDDTFWRQAILKELMDMVILDDVDLYVVFPCGTSV